MAVNIVWSLTNGGSPITDVVDHGDVGNGNATTAKELFLRHDGLAEITLAGLYTRQFAGNYAGSFTASADFSEVIGWGNGTTEAAFGGVQIHMGATGSYADAWPTYSSKSATNTNVCRSGTGDSEGNAITLVTATGASASGTIQTGSSPNVRFKTRLAVPSSEDTAGVRQWDLVLRYDYTS